MIPLVTLAECAVEQELSAFGLIFGSCVIVLIGAVVVLHSLCVLFKGVIALAQSIYDTELDRNGLGIVIVVDGLALLLLCVVKVIDCIVVALNADLTFTTFVKAAN